MKLIDANVILRYLLQEPEEQAEQARAVIEAGAFTTIEVMAEVVYVLQRIYSVERAEISTMIHVIAGEIRIENAEVVLYAAEIFRERKLDFVDCILAARAIVKQEDVFTFDKKLKAFIQSHKSGLTDEE